MRAGSNMDADDSRIWVYAIALILTIVLKAAFAACEHALIEVNDGKVRGMTEENAQYRQMAVLLEQPQRLWLSFSFQRALTNAGISILALLLANTLCWSKLQSVSQNGTIQLAVHVAYLLALVLITALVVVSLTDILPKRLVERNPERVALHCCGLVRGMIRMLTPFALLTHGTTFVLCKLFGVSNSAAKDSVTEEEIRMMVDVGNESGAIEESQREMINNIFEFDDVTVADVMTHRTELIAAEETSKIADLIYLAINEGVSRIPVYAQTVDSVTGLIYVKDLLCLVGCEHSEDFTLKQFIRKVMFVPETGKCGDVFQDMRREKAQMAIVVDEYGGTAGLVTMEDLLEEIVGNIQDEYDDEAAELVQLSDGVFSIDGDADPEDILPKLGATLPPEHQYDTMSALVVDILGRIPATDEMPTVVYQNLRFTVLLTEDNWINKLKAERLESVQIELEKA